MVFNMVLHVLVYFYDENIYHALLHMRVYTLISELVILYFVCLGSIALLRDNEMNPRANQ